MSNSIEQLVGQIIIAGFRGKTANEKSPIKKYILKYHIAGVILYDMDLEIGNGKLIPGTRNIESPTQKQFMKAAKQKLPGLDINKSITAPDNIDVLIKEGYLFKSLPKSPGEFLERMNVIPPESKLPSDILKNKINVQSKLEAYGRRIMFGQYKTYIKEAVKGKMTEELFSMRPVSVTDIGPRDLPKGMASTILESKEIQHGLPTGSLTGMKNVQQGMQTAASIEFLKDLQKTTKISTDDIAKQAIQGDFYEQLKDALKLLVKKG